MKTAVNQVKSLMAVIMKKRLTHCSISATARFTIKSGLGEPQTKPTNQ